MTLQLSIRRNPDLVQAFSVPYHPGMSLLDALRLISAGDAPDLAYRWECGGQRICGVCTVRVNGQPALSCGVLVQPDTHYLVEPLDGFPVERDLIVDLHERLDTLNAHQPYLIDGGKPIETRAEAEASKHLRTCVECWACVSVCPVSLNTDSAHALSMVKLARFALDPRDGADRAASAREAGLDIYSATCPSCRRCETICPKDIDVFVHAIQVLEHANT
jgi:succinate dehydrogenase/fumarate reductase iron-sulfur protein